MYKDEEWLREKYQDKGFSMIEISNLCGCSDMTISRWLDRHGIEKRDGKFSKRHREQISVRTSGSENPFFGEEHNSETIQKMSGPRPSVQGSNNPNWSEDTVSEYGEKWSVIREEQIQDASRGCQVCHIERHEHFNEYGRDLHVHHIRPRSDFDDVDKSNVDENLVVLCVSCHAIAERGQILKLVRKIGINQELAPVR